MISEHHLTASSLVQPEVATKVSVSDNNVPVSSTYRAVRWRRRRLWRWISGSKPRRVWRRRLCATGRLRWTGLLGKLNLQLSSVHAPDDRSHEDADFATRSVSPSIASQTATFFHGALLFPCLSFPSFLIPPLHGGICSFVCLSQVPYSFQLTLHRPSPSRNGSVAICTVFSTQASRTVPGPCTFSLLSASPAL
jgi:hypothetical protein